MRTFNESLHFGLLIDLKCHGGQILAINKTFISFFLLFDMIGQNNSAVFFPHEAESQTSHPITPLLLFNV